MVRFAVLLVVLFVIFAGSFGSSMGRHGKGKRSQVRSPFLDSQLKIFKREAPIVIAEVESASPEADSSESSEDSAEFDKFSSYTEDSLASDEEMDAKLDSDEIKVEYEDDGDDYSKTTDDIIL